MKFSGVLAKAAALTSFTVLLAGYVAYEAGVFWRTPDGGVLSASFAGGNAGDEADSTKENAAADSAAAYEAEQKKRDSIESWMMAGSKSQIHLIDVDIVTRHKGSSTAVRKAGKKDSSARKTPYLMGSSKSGSIIRHTTSGTIHRDTTHQRNSTP